MKSQIGLNKCHVLRGVLCLNVEHSKMSEEYAKAYVAYANFSNYHMFVDNEACVKTIYNKLFWTAMDKLYGSGAEDDTFGLYLFLGIAIGSVFIIAILLLVIYFRRRKTDEYDSSENSTNKLTGP